MYQADRAFLLERNGTSCHGLPSNNRKARADELHHLHHWTGRSDRPDIELSRSAVIEIVDRRASAMAVLHPAGYFTLPRAAAPSSLAWNRESIL